MLLGVLERSVSFRSPRRVSLSLTVRNAQGSQQPHITEDGHLLHGDAALQSLLQGESARCPCSRSVEGLLSCTQQLKSTALCKNLIKGIGAADLAPFSTYPIAHRVSSRSEAVLPTSR